RHAPVKSIVILTSLVAGRRRASVHTALSIAAERRLTFVDILPPLRPVKRKKKKRRTHAQGYL
ncbi:MAG: hypothetical protein ACREEJ_11535, partial [Ensifer adhaerens]